MSDVTVFPMRGDNFETVAVSVEEWRVLLDALIDVTNAIDEFNDALRANPLLATAAILRLGRELAEGENDAL